MCINDNVFILITKCICPNYNLSGDGDSIGDLSPWGTRMRNKCPPQVFVRITTKKQILHEEKMGSYSPRRISH
jgi:hypothetical protein